MYSLRASLIMYKKYMKTHNSVPESSNEGCGLLLLVIVMKHNDKGSFLALVEW